MTSERRAGGPAVDAGSTGDAAADSTAVPSSPLEPVPMAPVPPPERRTRSGRNLPAAIGVGLALAVLGLASLYAAPLAFTVVIAAVVVLGVWELSNALHSAQVRMPVLPVAVGGAAMVAAAYRGGAESLLVALMLTVLAVFAWRMVESPSGFVRDVTAAVFAVAYVPFLASFTVLLVASDHGQDRVLVFLLMIVLSDVGGFAAGVLFGRHPLAPRISPKKSWEGLVGSALFAGVGGALAVPALLDGPAWTGVVVGLVLMLVGTVGDLVESMVKRDLGIKDMGRLLPGHGGVMDRLDSLLLASPVAYLLLTWLVPA